MDCVYIFYLVEVGRKRRQISVVQRCEGLLNCTAENNHYGPWHTSGFQAGRIPATYIRRGRGEDQVVERGQDQAYSSSVAWCDHQTTRYEISRPRDGVIVFQVIWLNYVRMDRESVIPSILSVPTARSRLYNLLVLVIRYSWANCQMVNLTLHQDLTNNRQGRPMQRRSDEKMVS